MLSQYRTLLPLVLVTVSLLWCLGCSDDDPVGPNTGTIEISSTPVSLNAAWTLTGPADLERTGRGNAAFDDLDAGEYTVTWTDTTGWATPETTTQDLDEGSTLLFAGEYVQQGMVVIMPLPASLDAPWLLNGPSGYSQDGHGADTIENLDPGDYTLEWSHLDGWSRPETSTHSLIAGGALDFEGEYLPDLAQSADEAMVFFRDVYSGREFERYEFLLSGDFIFVKKDGTADNFDTEMVIADRMFNGVAGQNNYIIADITIDLLEPQGVWMPTPENDPDFGGFPGSQFRPYDVFMQFAILGENLRLVVTGAVIFYVMDEGVDAPDFQLLGVRDLTIGAKSGTENSTWSSVRSLFN